MCLHGAPASADCPKIVVKFRKELRQHDDNIIKSNGIDLESYMYDVTNMPNSRNIIITGLVGSSVECGLAE